jgi:hypothetical protein
MFESFEGKEMKGKKRKGRREILPFVWELKNQ